MNLRRLPTIDPKEAKDIVPIKRGIYFWFNKENDELVYIGIAVGVGGLKKRIVSQHLNPKYLEYRTDKHTSKDEFQLKHAPERISKKDGLTRKGIDKSAFRKSIGRKLKLTPGEETVKYIHKSLYLRIYYSDVVTDFAALEKELVAKFQQIFNTAHK